MTIRLAQFLSVVILTLLLWRVCTSADDRVQTIPDIVVDAESPQVSSPLMMQAKLAESQHVLEGLLNHDFGTIRKAARNLEQLAELAPPRRDPRGDKVKEDRIYEHFRTEFVRLSSELQTMAGRKNLEGAAYVHQNMTATCIACHDHLREPATTPQRP